MSSPPIMLIEPDPFTGVGNKVRDYVPNYRAKNTEERNPLSDARAASSTMGAYSATGAGFDFNEIQAVSRPLNGIAVKPNTHAFVQVIDAQQTVISVFNQLGQPGPYAHSGRLAEGNAKHITDEETWYDHQSKPQNPDAANRLRRPTNDNIWPGGNTEANGNFSVESGRPGVDDQGNPQAQAWTDWILQSVREARAEKTQVVETFGDSYLYAFGERPRVLQFQGLLMNTLDYNWRAVFWENWDKYFRASKLIEMNARVYIGWEDIVVEGYPLQAVCTETADSPNAMTFSFSLFVTNYWNISMANKQSVAQMTKNFKLGMSQSRSVNAPVTKWELFDERNKKLNAIQMITGEGASALTPFGIDIAGAPAFLGGLGESVDDALAGAKTEEDRIWLEAKLRILRLNAQALVRLPYIAAASTGNNSATHLTSYVNAYLLKTARRWMGATMNVWQESEGFRDGGVNGWYGYGSRLLQAASERMGRWNGRLKTGGDFGMMMADMAMSGSFDVLASKMAYATVSALGIPYGNESGFDSNVRGTGEVKTGYNTAEGVPETPYASALVLKNKGPEGLASAWQHAESTTPEGVIQPGQGALGSRSQEGISAFDDQLVEGVGADPEGDSWGLGPWLASLAG